MQYHHIVLTSSDHAKQFLDSLVNSQPTFRQLIQQIHDSLKDQKAQMRQFNTLNNNTNAGANNNINIKQSDTDISVQKQNANSITQHPNQTINPKQDKQVMASQQSSTENKNDNEYNNDEHTSNDNSNHLSPNKKKYKK